MAQPAARPVIRLAELLGVLSLAADLGMGQPMEHVLRQCLISLRLAQRLGPGLGLTGPAFDAALEAIADFTDVKSPYTIGHSRAVADLAGEAARVLGLTDQAATLVRRAGLVHDLGRLGVPNTIWDKPGGLSHAETERVRLHPYLTERMLVCSPALAPLATVAAQHHERLDGSGYPRGLSGAAVSPGGRVLAAADFYHARTEPRPHRPASTAQEAAAQLRAEARAGWMVGEAAAA